MTQPNMPNVSVAGLQVPAVLVPRIITALRGTYPDLTAGLPDDPAVRAVLKHWVATTLASYEATLAEAPVVDAIESTREEFAGKARAAREKALQDAAAIVETPEEEVAP